MLLFTIDDSVPQDQRRFFEDLYQHYNRLMWYTAKSYTDSQSDAEDVLQDAVEKLLRRIPTLMEVPRCALGTYVVYTVRSVAINFQRHQAVVSRHTQVMDEEADRRESDWGHPQETLERKEALDGLAAVWPSLEPLDQEVLYRRYILGQSDAEMAQALGCKAGSVRVKLSRARRRALARMKEGGAAHDES